jgi:hypothetical protein
MIRARPALILLGVIFVRPLTAQTGAPLDPWTPGSLDIHHISTGLGNAALLILPDGTTCLWALAQQRAERIPHRTRMGRARLATGLFATSSGTYPLALPQLTMA